MVPQNKIQDAGKARRMVRLSLDLEKSISEYASAAFATGVSLLAMTRSVDAKIVYTPANVRIVPNSGSVFLDVNHDGIADFWFANRLSSTSGTSFATLLVGPYQSKKGNEFWGRGVKSGYFKERFGSALHGGIPVGPSKVYFRESPSGIMAKLRVAYNYLGYLVFSSTS